MCCCQTVSKKFAVRDFFPFCYIWVRDSKAFQPVLGREYKAISISLTLCAKDSLLHYDVVCLFVWCSNISSLYDNTFVDLSRGVTATSDNQLVSPCIVWCNVSSLIIFLQIIDINCCLLAVIVRTDFCDWSGMLSVNWYGLLASHSLTCLATLFVFSFSVQN